MKFSGFSIDQILANPAKIYLYIAVFFGLAFMAVTPPCSVPDEPVHLIRLFRVAQGDFFSSSQTKLPSLDAYCDLYELVGTNRSPQNLDKQLSDFWHETAKPLSLQDKTNPYPPVPYLPAAAAVKLLSFFQPNTAVYFYGAKLATFIASLLLTFAAIRMMPFGHWTMLVIALLPMRLYLMASFSPDAVTTSVAVLWIALVMNIMVSEGVITSRKLLLLAVVGLALAFSKPMYSFLLALILVVPFKKITHKSIFLKIAFILLLLAVTIKIGMMAKYLPAATVPVSNGEFKKNQEEKLATGRSGSEYFLAAVNPAAQVKYLLNDPIKILTVVVNGFAVSGTKIPKSFVGVFGWFNVFMTNGLYWFAYLILILSSVLNEQYKASVRFRVIALSLFATSLFIIPLGLYLRWTPVGSPYFQGLHGRYFLPFLPLLFLSLGGKWAKSYKTLRGLKLAVLISLLVFLTDSITNIYISYYNLPPAKGVLELNARSNANGVAYLYTLEQNPKKKRIRWKNEGIINLTSSNEVLSYQFRLPAKPVRSIKLIFAATGKLEFQIYNAQIKSLNGKLIRPIDLNKMQNISSSDIRLNSVRDKKKIPLAIILDSNHPTAIITFEDIPFDLSSLTTDQLSGPLKRVDSVLISPP